MTSTLRRPALIGGAAALLALALVGLGLYGTGWLTGNSGDCASTRPLLARLDSLSKGEVAAFAVAKQPQPAPAVSFEDPDRKPVGLADFRGRTVLLNLWATWCEPCRREMPALDQLQAKLGGPGFQVVAVNIDTRNPDKPKAWLAEIGVNRLAYYSDREAKIFQDLRRAGQAQGMPTTLLIDGKGCRLGTMEGPAEWSSPDGLALMRAAVEGQGTGRTQ